MNPTPEIIPEHQRRRPSTIAEQATLNCYKDLQGLRDYNASVRKFIFLVFFFIHKIREIAAYATTGNRISSIYRTLKDAAKIIRQKPRFRFHLVEVFLVY